MKNKRSLNKLGDNNRIMSETGTDRQLENVSTMAYKTHHKNTRRCWAFEQ